EDCLAFANLAGAYSTTKEGGTEAFRDRSALTSFIRQQGSTGRGALPLQRLTASFAFKENISIDKGHKT
ncbi:MAG: hypothetical protein WB781_12260, partial [Candidatus Sulfotelmatobacter sp.]